MISLVLPCYNHGLWLPRMLKSINRQLDKNYELIIINDGSTDNTATVLEHYAYYKIPTIVKNNKNLGLSKSLDIGHSLASCEYVTWISADCWLEPDFVKEFNDAKNSGKDVYQAKFNIYTTTRFLRTVCYSHLAPEYEMQNLGAAFLYSKEIWKRIKYQEFAPGYEDGMFYLTCRALALKFEFIDKVLYNYMLHRNSLSYRVKEPGLLRYNKGLQILKKRFPEAECWKTIKEYEL